MLLVGPEPRTQARAKGGLDPVHGGFGEGPPVVSMGELPVLLSKEVDFLDGAISQLQCRIRVQHGPGTWRGDEAEASSCGCRVASTATRRRRRR